MKKIYTLITGILILISLQSMSQIIHVPSDQPSIQAGINAASDGDTVLVANGTYLENINFMGKAITVASQFILDGDTNHISNTIIDGSEPENPDLGSVVTFDSGEDTTSMISGFTITGGRGTHFIDGPVEGRAGGGFFFDRSGGKLTNNYIIENEVTYTGLTMGGGICAGGLIDPLPWLVLRNNKIKNNSVTSTLLQANGGGMEIYYNLIMADNEIIDNEAIGAAISVGGGVSIRNGFGSININVANNIINQNKSISDHVLTEFAEAGGLFIALGCSGNVQNNIVSNNIVEAPADKQCFGAGTVILANNIDLKFQNNFVNNNAATSGLCFGGGLFVYVGGVSILNNVIQNNTATWGGGISVVNNNSDSLAVIINNTVSGNESAYGGGLYLLNADAVVVNTILWDDFASEEGMEIFEIESNLEVRHSDVEGGWPGNGNMDVDPKFREDGYRLSVWSTLLNEGTSSIQINGEWYDCPENDIDDQERPFSFEAEIGADEAMWNYVSLEENMIETSSIHMYPNPASSVVNFLIEEDDLAQTIEIDIYNSIGMKIQSFEIDQNIFSFHADQLPSGVYLVKCKINGKEMIKRLVVSR